MKKLIALLQDRNFIFILAMTGGMITDYPSRWTQPFIIPLLGVIMTLSVLNIPNRVFLSLKAMMIPACTGVGMTYLILGVAMLGLTFLFIDNPALRAGYILIASSPPAIAIIPFNGMLKGDGFFALFGIIGSYMAALAVLPLMAYLFLDISDISPMNLFIAAGGLIFMPVVISRFMLWQGWDKSIEPAKGIITDWCFFVVIYTIIGLNRRLILENPANMIPVAAVAFISVFLLGYLIERVGAWLRIRREALIPIVLLGTLKNFGLAGGIALTFFSREAALPSAACAIGLVLNIIWLNHRYKKRDQSGQGETGSLIIRTIP